MVPKYTISSSIRLPNYLHDSHDYYCNDCSETGNRYPEKDNYGGNIPHGHTPSLSCAAQRNSSQPKPSSPMTMLATAVNAVHTATVSGNQLPANHRRIY